MSERTWGFNSPLAHSDRPRIHRSGACLLLRAVPGSGLCVALLPEAFTPALDGLSPAASAFLALLGVEA